MYVKGRRSESAFNFNSSEPKVLRALILSLHQSCQSSLRKDFPKIYYDLCHKSIYKGVVACNIYFSEIFCRCSCNGSTYSEIH